MHNMKTGLGDLLTYKYEKQDAVLTPTEERFFQGYRRADGKAGVRNELWIIPTVAVSTMWLLPLKEKPEPCAGKH